MSRCWRRWQSSIRCRKAIKGVSAGGSGHSGNPLAQVAIWADHHLKVEKNSDGAVTESSIRAISESERELEIAECFLG